MRIVIKIGTNVLVNQDGSVDQKRLEEIVSDIAELRHKSHEIVIVSSGAVGLGKKIPQNAALDLQKRTWAALGQVELIKLYERIFSRFKLLIAQCLLLRNDFTNRERYANSVNTIKNLLKNGVVPIINENDFVATEETSVGDNDLLAAILAIAVKAEKLILITNQDGLFTNDPQQGKKAELVKVIKDIDQEIEKLCSRKASNNGRGGMLSKVKAAKHAMSAGIEVFIVNGKENMVASRILNGEQLGTRCVPNDVKELSEQKRWITSVKGYGKIFIDAGAVTALHRGKSLLFPGIRKVKGSFERKEIVEVFDTAGQLVAYGKVNFTPDELKEALIDKRGGKIKTGIDKEVIHRNYMTLLNKF